MSNGHHAQETAKEDLEKILASGMDEQNISRALIGLGMRGVYGSAIDVFEDLGKSMIDDDDATVEQKHDMIDKIALQASIYRSCEEFAKEGKLLDRLSVLSTGMREQEEETKLLQEDLVHREAIAAGARVCLNTECSRIEVGMKFEICGQCRTARYCSKTCQREHWKAHRKICDLVVGSSQPSL
eukprot:gene16613-3205_t